MIFRALYQITDLDFLVGTPRIRGSFRGFQKTPLSISSLLSTSSLFDQTAVAIIGGRRVLATMCRAINQQLQVI